jgi:hypothetical protein
MDITYITMARGFVYLAVVLDWFSRRALSWLSITMEAAFCVETLEDALWLVTANRTSLIPIRVRWADSSGRCNISMEGSCDGQVATASRSSRTGCIAFTRAAGGLTTRGT